MESTGNHPGTGADWIYIHRLLTPHQSLGWEHYEVHEPEPHILLFKYVVFPFGVNTAKLGLTAHRRPINYQPPMH